MRGDLEVSPEERVKTEVIYGTSAATGHAAYAPVPSPSFCFVPWGFNGGCLAQQSRCRCGDAAGDLRAAAARGDLCGPAPPDRGPPQLWQLSLIAVSPDFGEAGIALAEVEEFGQNGDAGPFGHFLVGPTFGDPPRTLRYAELSDGRSLRKSV